MGVVSGPCVDVCWIIKYKFDMMLFNDSVSFSMEDVSNYAALVYDVVSIFLPVCVICFCWGLVWVLGFWMVCYMTGSAKFSGCVNMRYEDSRLVTSLIKCITINSC